MLLKTVTGLLALLFTLAIKFHGVLHGSMAGCRIGNTSLKANLLQEIKPTREAVLYEVFMKLKNIYDALYQDRCLKIIVVYGVGPNGAPDSPYVMWKARHSGQGRRLL